MAFNLSYKSFIDLQRNLVDKKESFIFFDKLSNDIITPVAAFLKLKRHFLENIFLLESVEKGNNKGRFSIIGLMPDQIWRCRDGVSYLQREALDEVKNKGSIIESLKNFINNSAFSLENTINNSELNGAKSLEQLREQLNISSGVFGYFGYDFSYFVEDFPNLPKKHLKDPLQIDDAIFFRPQIIIVFDSLFDEMLICKPLFHDSKESDYEYCQGLLDKIKKIIIDDALPKSHNTQLQNKPTETIAINNHCGHADYLAMVAKAKEYITSGDAFQILPSQRFSADYHSGVDNFTFYRSLRSVNPSPFLFYFDFADFTLTGSSPEIMVAVKDRNITIRPLAGTRKLGESESENRQIAKELLADEKEVAEHLMLIDLGRNDVGRVAKANSVKLVKKMEIEKYSHVMHISSTVTGELLDNISAVDAVLSGFPAGTVSGAPKIRAMEIIAEIEQEKRSFYAGAVGYFASNGNSETCITLRSAVIKDSKIYFQSGAGVVFDSDPEAEYLECINKANALVYALQNLYNYC